MLRIEPAGLADLPGAYRVCVGTALKGDDATHLHGDPDLLGHVYVGAYLARGEGTQLVVVDEAYGEFTESFFTLVSEYMSASRVAKASLSFSERGRYWPHDPAIRSGVGTTLAIHAGIRPGSRSPPAESQVPS